MFKKRGMLIILSLTLLATLAFITSACTTAGVTARSGGGGEDGAVEAEADDDDDEKGASQLWDENCQRCHNGRDPASYSDAQWEVVVSHMRLRAGLDAKQARRILQFLQASN